MSTPSSDRAAVRQIIRHMKALGARVTTVDNDAEPPHDVAGLGEEAILKVMFQTDSDTVRFERGDEHLSVWFVYGNAPYEVAADSWPSPCKLEEDLDSLMFGWEE